MYSLVNMPTVVRDLARHPRAHELAGDLLHALTLTATDLDLLQQLPYDVSAAARLRADLLAEDRARPRALTVLAAAREMASGIGVDAYSLALVELEHAPLGDLDELLRFVRHEVLAKVWTGDEDVSICTHPRAVAIVTDAVTATYSQDPRLGYAWREFCDDHVVALDPTWPDIVATIAQLPHEVQWPNPPASWSLLMHDACWAVHVTGRERTAALTQLRALRLLTAARRERLPLRAVATVIAAVHASVVADVLDADTHAAMTQPLFSLLS
jgi:hypothetical protein